MIVNKISHSWIALFLFVFVLAGCRGTQVPPTVVSPTGQLPPTAEIPPTPDLPTATLAPLAARVNGEPILLAEFEAELARYQAANPEDTADLAAQRQTVLDDMIAQQLLAQAARQAGFQMDDAALQTRMDTLAAQAGGYPALQDWMQRNQYTEEGFRSALKVAAAAAWQRDQVIAAAPTTAEQVHARQILVLDEADASQVLAQVRGGADMALLAYRYDPVTGGELGWFPRGYLTQPEVEEAAFALQAGEVSEVIKSAIGYHIIQVIERDPQRQLSADARKVLQEKMLRDWVQQQQDAGAVEILLQ